MPRKTKMNSITSAELIAQINPVNAELLRDFLDYLKSVQRSQGTIDGYLNDLQIFFVWNVQHNGNKAFASITKRNIVAYQNWLLNENGNSPARVRRLKAALSSLSNYIEAILSDDEPEYKNFRNIINKIENPVLQPVREKTVMSEEDIEKLLSALVDRKKYQKACLVALAAFSGRRKSELTRFKVSDFCDDKLVCNGALYKSSPIKTKGRGGGKYIPCYTLAKKFKPYLDLWMDYRKETGITCEYLFVSPTDPAKPLSVAAINSWMVGFGKILGMDVYAHSFRHNFTSYLAKSGIPDGVIADIVGWESVDMVKIYNDNSREDQIAMYFGSDGEISAGAQKSISDL